MPLFPHTKAIPKKYFQLENPVTLCQRLNCQETTNFSKYFNFLYNLIVAVCLVTV